MGNMVRTVQMITWTVNCSRYLEWVRNRLFIIGHVSPFYFLQNNCDEKTTVQNLSSREQERFSV